MCLATGGKERTTVELGVCKEAHKVSTVAGGHMVSLKMEGNVVEGGRVAINVEGLYSRVKILAILLGRLDLAEEVLGEVGRG